MSVGIRGMKGLRSWVALSVLLANPAVAANAQPPQSNGSPPAAPDDLETLDEVLVIGEKPTRQAANVIAWMRRLVGRFNYEGHVDLQGKGNAADLRPVNGWADCVGFGPAPGVQCQIDVRWPEMKGSNVESVIGAVSNLSPAMMLYGFEPKETGVRFMLVDSKGIAEPALGMLTGDTLTAREPCVNVPGNCQRIIRITAAPDLKVIHMQIDMDVDYRKAAGFTFVMRRVVRGPPPPLSGASQ